MVLLLRLIYPSPLKNDIFQTLLFVLFVAALIVLPVGVALDDTRLWWSAGIFLGLGLVGRIFSCFFPERNIHPHGMPGLMEILLLVYFALPLLISGIVTLFLR